MKVNKIIDKVDLEIEAIMEVKKDGSISDDIIRLKLAQIQILTMSAIADAYQLGLEDARKITTAAFNKV